MEMKLHGKKKSDENNPQKASTSKANGKQQKTKDFNDRDETLKNDPKKPFPQKGCGKRKQPEDLDDGEELLKKSPKPCESQSKSQCKGCEKEPQYILHHLYDPRNKKKCISKYTSNEIEVIKAESKRRADLSKKMYKEKYPENVTASKKKYVETNPEKVTASSIQHPEKYSWRCRRTSKKILKR